ncbi:MAG: hypothetical protein JWN41_226 [Thermoleophilia bacterium]|nr:hypothetical protein [Thermoleophilia bacterium]
MTAMIALAGATFVSPIALKSDAFAQVGKRLSGEHHARIATEAIAAGGFSYDMPSAWGRLGGSTSTDTHGNAAGVLVSAVCPAGDTGTACRGGVQVSFISYRGGKGHELPVMSAMVDTFNREFRATLRGFRLVKAAPAVAADGRRWQRYEFTYATRRGVHRQVLGGFRHADGSGVIVAASGPTAAVAGHERVIDGLLASATESTPGDATAAE